MGTRIARGLALALALAVTASAGACGYKDPSAAELITETFTMGPFDLAPKDEPGWRATGWRSLTRPAGDIAVKGIRWKVIDGAGTEIPNTDHRIHFHHVVAYSTKNRNDPTCGFTGAGERFAAPGSERTPLTLPNGYAYFTGAGDTWSGNYDIMNESPVPQTGIRVTYEVTYTRNRTSLHDVQPYWLDLAGCSPAGIFTVPGGGEPGSIYTKTSTFTLPRLGMVVGVRSHMHDGGIDVTTARDDGQVICKGTAVYDDGSGGSGHENGGHEHGGPPPDEPPSDGHTSSVPRIKEIPFCGGLNVPVVADQRVTVTARYHNENAMSDAMAKVLVYVAEVPGTGTTTTTRPRPTRPPTTAPVPTTAGPATTGTTTTAPVSTTSAPPSPTDPAAPAPPAARVARAD